MFEIRTEPHQTAAVRLAQGSSGFRARWQRSRLQYAAPLDSARSSGAASSQARRWGDVLALIDGIVIADGMAGLIGAAAAEQASACVRRPFSAGLARDGGPHDCGVR